MLQAPQAPLDLVSSDGDLISSELRERMVAKIAKDEKMERSLAERIVDESLQFLLLCARNPEKSFVPSALVDIGWHTFILYTREYVAFCDQHAGTYIHHSPSDVHGVSYPKGGARQTVDAMVAQGFEVDFMLWETIGDCSNYCSGDSCSGGGR